MFLVLSEMKHHYFAGYSQPLKFIVPGLASLRTACANHAWALDERARAGRHPWHPDPTRRDNPLAEDLVEASELFFGSRPAFAFVSLASPPSLAWASGGRLKPVTKAGIARVDEFAVENWRGDR